jgi:3,5-dioxohexanoate:acetyl-CoA acetone transferase
MAALEKVFISCAITGGMTVPSQSAAIPVTPEEIVESAVAAHEAGAAIVHVHVREPETGRPSADLGLFTEVLAGIGERCAAIVQPTTGGGVGMTIEERAHVVAACRPEMATFNAGSFNFGIFQVSHRPEMAPWEIEYLESTREYVFRNTFADMYRLAEVFREAGTKPEFETYDVGHLYNVLHLLEQNLVDPPLHVQFVLGVLGANAATIEQLVHMRQTALNLFGADTFTWSAAGVGYPGEFHLVATALMLGGHVRVGLEDNLRVTSERRATSNAELVDKALALAPLLDRDPASADEARSILGLAARATTSPSSTVGGGEGEPH